MYANRLNIISTLKLVAHSAAKCLWGGLIILAPVVANAQVSSDYYRSSYNSQRTSSITIKHKRAKWFKMRENISMSEGAKKMDTFEDEVEFFEPDALHSVRYQASHTYIDTIYVTKGNSVRLTLPEIINDQISVRTYQRWYNYTDDNTFRVTRATNQVVDLLTPLSSGNAYRFANGYVGKPLTNGYLQNMDFYYPTDAQFSNWFDASSGFDNKSYVVACDVSGYNDFASEYSANPSGTISNNFMSNQYEPTLAHRVLFYIIGVDGSTDWTQGRIKDAAYQGGGNGSGKKYLEEYEITFPSSHISNNTDELVTLGKDARGYALSVETGNPANLNISLADDNAGLELITTSLSASLTSANRVISFRKRNVRSNTPWKVNDGSTATILVTKRVGSTTYNIARYKLTFKDDNRLLTQTQVSRLGTNQANSAWNYVYRSPSYMKENLQLLTSLTWDYDASVTDNNTIQPGYYPFPMAWDNSSYAFYDGSNKRNFPTEDSHLFTEWGSYSIVSSYVGYGDRSNSSTPPANLENSKDNNSTFFMYIDVSDRPGTIARIPFREKLCQGSELIVTAWVKSAGNSNNNDGALLFTVLGVKEDPVTKVKAYTPIYRHCTSQIRTTTYMNNNEPGTGAGHNEWFQTYFSFVNSGAFGNFDSYVLQVDNNSASTNGGDIYLDEIKVYLMKPSAEILQLETPCTGQSTLMKMSFDWQRLTSRLGIKDIDNITTGVNFCFIDEIKYNAYLAAHPGDKEDAIKYALVGIRNDNTDGEETVFKVSNFRFKAPFNANKPYVAGRPNFANDNLGLDQSGKFNVPYFYSETDEAGVRALQCDFYSVLSPNRPYLVVIEPEEATVTTAPYASEQYVNDWVRVFAQNIDDACGIQTRFFVQGQSVVKMDGEAFNPAVDYCVGQIYNFSLTLQVNVVDENDVESVVPIPQDKVWFDWYLGPEDEFIYKNLADPASFSIEEALYNFREFYKEDVKDFTTVKPQTGNGVTFTQEQLDLLKSLANPTDGASPKLVLSQKSLHLTLLEEGLQAVIQPIKTLLKAEDFPDLNIKDADWGAICWKYVPLFLTASGDAPSLHLGYDKIKYPSEYFNPSLRIGQKQIAATSNDSPIRLDLRGAKLVSSGATQITELESLDGFKGIYLISTNDPYYNKQIQDAGENFDKMTMSMGTIVKLLAKPYTGNNGAENYVLLYFNDDFKSHVKEGYEYVFTLFFEESVGSGSVGNSCFGKFPFTIKVVPEYLVWQGGAEGDKQNWNNDNNWKRADNTDLNYTESEYVSNARNLTSNGYVPMLFSKAVMPADSKSALYMAGFDDGGNWVRDAVPEGMESPTMAIQYDMFVTEDNHTLSSHPYRVNLCDQIHFMPNAQMRHAEYLMYSKAWMDFNMPTKNWQLIATPLNAVVAGDWYTQASGTQADLPLFRDITFANGYSRVNPEVYQRSWLTDARVVEKSTQYGASFAATAWSTAYNDAYVPYPAGSGHSLKAYLGNADATLHFRLPKADTSYEYATGALSRTGEGKWAISALADRSNPDKLTLNDNVSVELVASQDGQYYLVGNPFLTTMNLKTFFEKNPKLAKKYWTVDGNGPLAGTAAGDKWTTVEGTTIPALAPGKAMFVQLLDAQDVPDAIVFTHDMQDFPASPSAQRLFSVHAAGAKGVSTASLAYAEDASDAYLDTEDIMLLQDVNLQNQDAPMVYTIAGDKAVIVNHIKNLRQIPLGVFCAAGQDVTLTFNNVEAMYSLKLYDALTDSETPVTEGMQVTFNGSSHGRFFLRTAGGELTEISTAESSDNDVSVYSVVHGEVIVSSLRPIHGISVYTANGKLLKQFNAGGATACTITGVDSNICLVTIVTDARKVSRKVVVKQ